MPLYDMRCSSCGALSDHQCKIAERNEPIDCPLCEAKACCRLKVGASPPNFGTEKRQGSKKLIYSETQVTDEYGGRWRDKGTTGKEGGAGKIIYGHR